jgi:HPt (histidine-containing phosphotransfer) domain-containing protein
MADVLGEVVRQASHGKGEAYRRRRHRRLTTESGNLGAEALQQIGRTIEGKAATDQKEAVRMKTWVGQIEKTSAHGGCDQSSTHHQGGT